MKFRWSNKQRTITDKLLSFLTRNKNSDAMADVKGMFTLSESED